MPAYAGISVKENGDALPFPVPRSPFPLLEVPGHDELGITRRLPARTGGERIAYNAGVRFVALVHVDHLLVVEQVEHRQAGGQVDAVDRQLPGHVCVHVPGPRQVAEGTPRGVLEHALVPGTVAVRDAQPARSAAAAFGGEGAGREGVVRPDDAERRDRTARLHPGTGAERPLLVDRVRTTQLELVAEVVEQPPVAFVDRRV